MREINAPKVIGYTAIIIAIVVLVAMICVLGSSVFMNGQETATILELMRSVPGVLIKIGSIISSSGVMKGRWHLKHI